MLEAEPPARLLGDRYRLGACLGGGGMADVYRASDIRLERLVAVKVFRSGTDESGRARFEEEARLLAGLNHPGLVPLYDAGAGDGELYLVMHLVSGETLSSTIARGPMPSGHVAEIGRQLAEVLGYVHDNGIVHRDVKPSNVLISQEGRVFLADFGISRLADAVGQMTGTGIIMGTATYMAPEQVRGDHVGFPADVYALGLVLLECVTGQVEYAGSGVETAVARLARQPHVPVGVPEPLGGLLRSMTALDPAQRPSAAECAAALSPEAIQAAVPPPTSAESTTDIRPVLATTPATTPATATAASADPADPPTIPGTRMFGAEAPLENPPKSRGIVRFWPWLAAGAAGVVLLLAVLLLLPSVPEPTDSSAQLPPAAGPPGAARLPEDLANLDRLVHK